MASNVYKALGSGHSEIVYHKALEVELRIQGYRYSSKPPVSIYYKNTIVGYSECDIIVHLSPKPKTDVIIELKATTYEPRSSEKAQIHCYMRTLKCPYGILINFPQPSAKSIRNDIDVISFGILDEEVKNEIYLDLE